MAQNTQQAGMLLAMLHNMPREQDGTLRNAPNDRDYVGLGLTTAEFVAARDALIASKQVEVTGETWRIVDLTAVPQGYTPGFDGIPPVETPEAAPRSIEQVAAGLPATPRTEVNAGEPPSGPAKPVPVAPEPQEQKFGPATNTVPEPSKEPAPPAKATKVNEATAKLGETDMPPAPDGSVDAEQAPAKRAKS